MQSRHNGGDDKSDPDEGAENDSSHTRAPDRTMSGGFPPVTPERSHGDPGSEPEDHGEGLDAGNSKLVRRSGIARWSEDEVGDGEESPDGAKQHEVDAVRRPRSAPGIAVFINNVGGKTQDDDREEGLHRTKGQNCNFKEGHVEVWTDA